MLFALLAPPHGSSFVRVCHVAQASHRSPVQPLPCLARLPAPSVRPGHAFCVIPRHPCPQRQKARPVLTVNSTAGRLLPTGAGIRTFPGRPRSHSQSARWRCTADRNPFVPHSLQPLSPCAAQGCFSCLFPNTQLVKKRKSSEEKSVTLPPSINISAPLQVLSFGWILIFYNHCLLKFSAKNQVLTQAIIIKNRVVFFF